MQHLPLFAALRGRACLVVGGGTVAMRRVNWLRRCEARITVLAPEFVAEIRAFAANGEVTLIERPWGDDALDEYWLVIAATDDVAVNAAVSRAAEAAKRFCNVVDAPELCSFIMPAIIDRDPVTVAISTAGTSPVLARWIKGTIETLLPARIGAFARFLSERRAEVSRRIADPDLRRRFWQRLVDGEPAREVYAGRDAVAETGFRTALERSESGVESAGEAWIVGAGPGDAGLITVRGRQLLAQADVVLYDRLVNPEILEYARRDAEFISVGKQAGGRSTPQAEIDALLVRLVGEGRLVCRLKGGDPMVFARLAEELTALNAHGLRYQIVPGVSAIAGCAAYAGIPLTWRSISQSLLMTTGHTRVGGGVDLGANPEQRTVALYMAGARHAATAAALIELGHAADTPVAIVENGTLASQRVRRTTLAALADASAATEIGSPALLIVGHVVTAARELAWLDTGTDADSTDDASVV